MNSHSSSVSRLISFRLWFIAGLTGITVVLAMLLHTHCGQPVVQEPITDAKQSEASEEPPVLPEQAGKEAESQKPLDQKLASDETRAGQITQESEQITGPAALSRVGDWKIYNARVAFAIHGLRPSQSWSTSTGHLIDASPVDETGKATLDALEEIFSIVSLFRVAQAKEIKVIESGGAGQRAVIRVVAKDAGIPVIDSVLNSRRVGGTIEIDYILEPSAAHLVIETRIKDDPRERSLDLGDGVLFGDQTRWISSLVGWNVSDVKNKALTWFGAVGTGVSYLMTHAEANKTLSVPLTQAAVYPLMGGLAKEDEAVGRYQRLLFVGRGGVEEMLTELRKIRPQPGLQTLTGTATGASPGVPVAVALLDSKKVALSYSPVDKQGKFSFEVPAGEYTLQAEAEGHLSVAKTGKPGETVTLTLAPRATLVIDLKEAQVDKKIRDFLPARVELRGPSFHERFDLIARQQPIHVPAGTYTLLICRGLTHEFIEKSITLEAGKTTTLTETLQQAVDTTGYVSSDLHLHSTPSIDSELSLEKRVSALVAEGVQFAAATDHDTWTDYEPIVKKLNLSTWIKTVIGQEVSPLGFHTNAYPLTELPKNEDRYFAAPWTTYQDGEFVRALEAPEIWKKLREQYKVPIIQINHPRRGQALFNLVSYDPKTGVKAVKPEKFDNNWDVMEAYNGKDRDDFLTSTLFDYFSFLNQGWYKTAVGNSDSHGESSRPGLARSLIQSSQQEGDKIDVGEITKNLKENRVLVYGGPMIRIKTATGEGPGARLQGASAEISLEIQAPSWVAVSYVKVYANGTLQETIPVPESKDRIRLQKTIKLEPKQDTWYIFLAGDEKKDMSPVYPGVLPVSMTNPIYLDIDGNGFQPTWQP